MNNNSQSTEYEIPKDYDPLLFKIRHSAAHILAQAVKERFDFNDQIMFAIGPPIEEGFYYDFLLPRSINEEDLGWIESRMKEIIKENHMFQKKNITVSEAKKKFENQKYKLEIINDLITKGHEEVTIYQQDHFYDLCRGPHVESTGKIDSSAIKILKTSGAYWKGDNKNAMLTRIYGTAWLNKKDLKKYIWKVEEASKRDHRKIGKELELFHIDPTAPGMPYWLPNGLKVLNELINFWREEHEQNGYQEISTPLVNEKSLWETSGHWDHYRENMFTIPVDEHSTYGLKPMNCPNAMLVYNLKIRSYKDLPLRLSDVDVLHRKESSGSLHGLLRTQKFQQDDAHIFLTADQIGIEFKNILAIAKKFYEIFNLKYTFRLGTRPVDYIGDLESWNTAENTLKELLNEMVGQENYYIEEGDGAFYGPKVDIIMEDAIGRKWQMGTIQLDFQLPRRFNCTYVDSNGNKQHPIVIHRVIYGSLERFMGVLIEHTMGKFPLWLSPLHVKVIPVTETFDKYAQLIVDKLKINNIKTELSDSYDGRLNARIREAQLMKTPYMLIIGEKELANSTVSVRRRDGENIGELNIETFIDRVKKEINTKLNF
ncbi:TPA: threonine--tRNA ligase [Bacillus cereus]|uniref:threonine--tRNA ligase n=1 Tax=Bacillus TaxID=1386 RepID=UPI000BF388A2|nr:threonine--tRNA ligase [Bacillus thuringiensis]PFU70395.1 threonine--tRNA ligase [Bacillus thuringiensis]RAS90255.1 threonine--tRNA ligase [Bacillus cereus]HDR8129095.1 threonine--tRNA ligase [Bacillus cereus]HDR8493499.1 threonine--tRNA ligase [Bacillus cereus]